MELKPLGNTGVMIPEIGLGVWKYRGGVEPLRRGVELGAFLIDTAEMYRTEDVVGQAVQGMRDRVFIASKVSGSHLRYDDVLRAADASLRELQADCIDLYQVHWPNARVPIKETMRAMETLVDRGLVKYIGVSNFSVGQLRAAQAALSKSPIVSNQVLYNLNSREIEDDLLPYCQQQNVTIIAYTPLDDGRLATKSRFRRSQGMKVMEEVASQVGKTLAQVALNWCTSRPNVIAIPKSDSTARTEENCGASGWRLSPEQMRRLDEAFA
ncbi:MAG: aldo/keto reductase [Candidatus Binatia bacterium]